MPRHLLNISCDHHISTKNMIHNRNTNIKNISHTNKIWRKQNAWTHGVYYVWKNKKDNTKGNTMGRIMQWRTDMNQQKKNHPHVKRALFFPCWLILYFLLNIFNLFYSKFISACQQKKQFWSSQQTPTQRLGFAHRSFSIMLSIPCVLADVPPAHCCTAWRFFLAYRAVLALCSAH